MDGWMVDGWMDERTNMQVGCELRYCQDNREGR